MVAHDAKDGDISRLAISRKVGQSFTIGKHVRVHVIEVTPSRRVRIGIDAPPWLHTERDDAREVKL